MPVYTYLEEPDTAHFNKNALGDSDIEHISVKDRFIKRRRVQGGNMRWTLDAVHLALIELIKFRENTPTELNKDYTKRLPARALEAVYKQLAQLYPVAFGAVQPQTLRITYKLWFRRRVIWDSLESKGARRNEKGEWLATDTVVNTLSAEFGEDAVKRTLEITSEIFPFKFELEYLQNPPGKVPLNGFLALMQRKTTTAVAQLRITQNPESLRETIADKRSGAASYTELTTRNAAEAHVQEQAKQWAPAEAQKKARDVATARLQAQYQAQTQVRGPLSRATPHDSVPARLHIPPPVMPRQSTLATEHTQESAQTLSATAHRTPSAEFPDVGESQSDFEESEEETEGSADEVEHEAEQEVELEGEHDSQQDTDQEPEHGTGQDAGQTLTASTRSGPQSERSTPSMASDRLESTDKALNASQLPPVPRLPLNTPIPASLSESIPVEYTARTMPPPATLPRAIEQYAEDTKQETLAVAEDPAMREILVVWKLLQQMRPELDSPVIDRVLLLCTIQPRLYKSVIACSLTADCAAMASFLKALARLSVSDPTSAPSAKF